MEIVLGYIEADLDIRGSSSRSILCGYREAYQIGPMLKSCYKHSVCTIIVSFLVQGVLSGFFCTADMTNRVLATQALPRICHDGANQQRII
jgi:hypothetical protein